MKLYVCELAPPTRGGPACSDISTVIVTHLHEDYIGQVLCTGDTIYTLRHLAVDQVRPVALSRRPRPGRPLPSGGSRG
jgi:glyoxylase-like metal-dependent hydrolase (beta-lactamase superfamily II)